MDLILPGIVSMLVVGGIVAAVVCFFVLASRGARLGLALGRGFEVLPPADKTDKGK